MRLNLVWYRRRHNTQHICIGKSRAKQEEGSNETETKAPVMYPVKVGSCATTATDQRMFG